MTTPARSGRPARVDDPLEDFEARLFAYDGQEKKLYTAGTGPAVVVMPEMPGISPEVARFARWVRDAGFRVYVPSLFGRDGAAATADEGAEVMKRACVSAEFRVFAGGGSSPVVDWLRALARQAQAECGGELGVVGMCFTGNFALMMTLEPAVTAPVLAQPSLPLDDPGALALTESEGAAVRDRIDRDDLTVLGYRFAGDRWCTGQRFAAYQTLLGDRFVGRVLPDEAANPDPPPFFAEVVASPHSVLTAHLVDADGQPTTRARDEVISFLRSRLC